MIWLAPINGVLHPALWTISRGSCSSISRSSQKSGRSNSWASSAPVSGARPGRAATSILVEVDDPKMGLLRFIALENYLSDLLGVKVDLVEKETLKPGLGRHVLDEAESI